MIAMERTRTVLTLVVLFLALASIQAQEPDIAFGPVQSDYVGRGLTIPLADLNVYIAFPGQTGNGNKGVVWGHDIFGPTSGRTFELVDQLAADTEYTVFLPDFFRGEVNPPLRKYTWEDYVQSDWEEKLKPLIESFGITSVGTVGTCWGAYFEVHASADPLVKAGLSAHPAHPSLMAINGENEEEQYNLINAVGGAQYYFPTPTESNHTRPGGLADQILDILFIEEQVAPCVHGYFNRGDLNDPEVAACVDYTYSEMINFFAEYL